MWKICTNMWRTNNTFFYILCIAINVIMIFDDSSINGNSFRVRNTRNSKKSEVGQAVNKKHYFWSFSQRKKKNIRHPHYRFNRRILCNNGIISEIKICFTPKIEIITFIFRTKTITILPDSNVIAYLIISSIHFGVIFLLQQNVRNCRKPLKMEWLLHPN